MTKTTKKRKPKARTLREINAELKRAVRMLRADVRVARLRVQDMILTLTRLRAENQELRARPVASQMPGAKEAQLLAELAAVTDAYQTLLDAVRPVCSTLRTARDDGMAHGRG